MDFNFGKPSHVLALLLLIGGFFLIFVLPIITFILMINYPNLFETIEISESIAIQSQLILIAIFIVVPFIWYFLVNKFSFKDISSHIKLVGENIDIAFLWGILAAIAIFVIIFVMEFLLISLGYKSEDLSNIPDIQKLFSPAAMFFLVGIQPIGEEIFFRGFLLEKIDSFAGDKVAIFSTSVLFGIAHMSYGKIFPVVMPILMGVILGFIVVKTKNLFSSIIAHVVFNLTSLTLAYLGSELLKQSSLIL